MFNKKWHFIVAAFFALVFVVREFMTKHTSSKAIDMFRDELQRRVDSSRKEAIKHAEEDRDDVLNSGIDDWLDDELGPD